MWRKTIFSAPARPWSIGSAQFVVGAVTAVDADKNQVLTKDEINKHRESHKGDPKKHIDARFAQYDTNKNGKIERSESKLPAEIFTRIDTNKDGAITKEEALAAHEARAKGRDKAKRGEAKRGDKPERGNEGRRGPRGHFEHMDTNGDGQITATEAKAAADERFSRVDLNKDNVITKAEVGQAMKAHHAKKRGEGHTKKRK